MQDVQPITNGLVGGRLLLRRLNHQDQGNDNNSSGSTNNNYQLLHHHHHQQPPQAPALKCPRCDSLNTKFCYYNNYNLSQPRHFCKNCRRYWTKGGVLRNVPVGGGCRKSKRSSKPKSSLSSANISKKTAHSSHSSSESSSTPPTVCGGALFQIPEVENFGMSSEIDPNLFSGDIGGFMNLINNSNENENNDNNNNNTVMVEEGSGTASFSEYLQNHQGVQEWDMGKICGVPQEEEDKIGGSIDLVVDPTVRIEDFLQSRGNNVGFTTLDWHLSNNDDHINQSLYEVPESSTVDHHDYWNQSTTAVHHQWSDSTTGHHLPLFLP